MKPLIVPDGADPGECRGVPETQRLLAYRGYDATLQEAYNLHVWLARYRGVDVDLLLRYPITDEEFDAALAAGVFVLEEMA